VIGASSASAADMVPVAIAMLLCRLPKAQLRLTGSTIDVLMPQRARQALLQGFASKVLQHAAASSRRRMPHPVDLYFRNPAP